MNAWELDGVLARLRGAHGPKARRLAHALRDVAAEPWFDAGVAAAVRAACVAAGLEPPSLVPSPLAVGEAWLLLHDPGTDSGVAGRIRASGGAAARLDVEAALRGLEAACGRLCRRLALDHELPAFAVFTGPRRERPIDGRSAGAAACAAVASRALRRPARSDTAASAVVELDGRLSPVEHLAQKLVAARAAHPQVTRVVVADAQESVPAEGLVVVRAARLENALDAMGLDLRALPVVSLSDHEVRLAGYEAANRKAQDGRAWRRLALEAWETMQAFAGSQGDPRLAARAGSWSALFSLHGGDVELAERTLDAVRAAFGDELGGETRAWCAIVDASRAIDDDPAVAITAAQAARTSCDALSGEGRDRFLGLALGTLGRALMHARRLDEAEEVLRAALAHHEETRQPREVPRSGCHLATCLRVSGRLEEAGAMAEQMIASCEALAAWDGPGTTRLYLAVEHGRCLLEGGRPAEALSALAPALTAATDYPRASALRAAAAAHRRLGDDAGAWEATRACFDIRRRSGGVLARVAALAAGEALLVETDAERRARARAEWLAVYPSEEPSAIAAALAATIY